MKLHFKKYGSGQPLLILHGLFGCSDNWQYLGKKFSANFQVYLIDQRDHGHSPHSNSISYELMAEDIKELIVDEKLNNSIVLGHSMGGKTAMRLTQLHPNYINKLIVADIGRKKYQNHHEHIINGLNSIDLNHIKSRSDAKHCLFEFVKEENVLQFLLKNLYWIKKGQLSWRMNLPLLRSEINEILEEIPKEITLTPTLFLKGERSNYILESDIEDLDYYFPNNEFETIYNAGHWIHVENPIDFYHLVMNFIKS